MIYKNVQQVGSRLSKQTSWNVSCTVINCHHMWKVNCSHSKLWRVSPWWKMPQKFISCTGTWYVSVIKHMMHIESPCFSDKPYVLVLESVLFLKCPCSSAKSSCACCLGAYMLFPLFLFTWVLLGELANSALVLLKSPFRSTLKSFPHPTLSNIIQHISAIWLG